MAGENKTITDLPDAVALTGSEPIPVVQGGVTVQTTAAAIAALSPAGSVTSVSVTTANGVSGAVANPTTTPAISLTLGAITPSSVAIGAGSTITSSGPGGALGTAAFTNSTAYEVPLTFSTGLTRTVDTITVNTSQSIATLSNLTSNGLVTTSGGVGTLGITAMGSNVATALGVNVGSAGAFVVNGGALGTPSSGVATNLTGLPISSGVSGLGTGVATAAAINIGSAGALVTFNGALGTPASGVATNLSGLPLTTGVTGLLPIANGGTATATPALVQGTGVTITGSWPNQTINATGLGGTVTSVSVTTANGVSGSVATATTTPAITLTLGAITPSTVTIGAGSAITSSGAGGALGSNAFTSTAYLPLTGGTLTGGIGFSTTNTLDIGTNASTLAPRTVYAGTSFVGPVGTFTTSIASPLATLGTQGTTQGSLVLANTNSTFATTLKSSNSTSAAWTMTLPVTAGTNGYVLSTDGSGVTSWIATSGGGGTVTSVGLSFSAGAANILSNSGTVSPITASGTYTFAVAGTSGGIPYFDSSSSWNTSAALAANSLVKGGGAGVAPSTITTGTGVLTALGVNVGSAGAFVTFNGALGTPSSGTATNLTGLPLTTGVTGALPAANGGTGQTTYTKGDLLVTPGSTTVSKLAVGSDGQVLTADAASTNGVKWSAAAGGGWALIGSISPSGASATFSSVSSSYSEWMVQYIAVTHDGGGANTIQFSISGDNGSTKTTATSGGPSIGTSPSAGYGYLEIPINTGGVGIARFGGSNTATLSADYTMSIGATQTLDIYRISAQLNYIQFVLSAGANFNGGTIKLWGR